MLFGLFFRTCGFALNAGLVFLLSPQEPELPSLERKPASVWHETRSTIFRGLHKVRIDLDSSRGGQITGKREGMRVTEALCFSSLPVMLIFLPAQRLVCRDVPSREPEA